MTEQEREQIEEAAVREYAWRQKKEKDRDTLRAYEQKLRGRKKHYTKMAEAYCLGGRRNRAAALGECCLQAMEQLEKESYKHTFLPGTLSWIINEGKATDTDGKKGYRYAVIWHVLADEPALTEEEILKEMEETRTRIEAETREMFGEMEEKDGEPGEAEGEEPAEIQEAPEKDPGEKAGAAATEGKDAAGAD